ncbi:hypothetical protein [Klebsiella quasipneumoniae]|uniref:hypothetical protein n=1 Tax=Klebsiella quasipneumoniae TaxID=1463165 RepID=UPI001E409CA3|nr:hypothetical protein [Klebsiella quasipneumoniae]
MLISESAWEEMTCLFAPSLDGILLGVIKFGVMIAGIVFFVWGIGYKLAFWGQHDPNTIYASANDVILPNLALGTGVLIAGWVYISYLKR